MRSQLSFMGRVVCSLYVLLLYGHSVLFAAEKYDINGTVTGVDGKSTVELLGTGKVRFGFAGENISDKTNNDGEFKLKGVPAGEHTLHVLQDKK